MRTLHDDNMTHLKGRIGQIEEKTITRDGESLHIVNFSLCIERSRRVNEDHEPQARYENIYTMWMECEAFGPTADDCAKFKKGLRVKVEGELVPREDYTDNDKGVTYKNHVKLRVARAYLDPSDLAGFEPRERKGPREAASA